MKNKLIVLSSWTEPKEKTWSGTTWSMTQALSKYYDVEIRDLKIPNWLDLVERFSRIPLIGVWFGCFFDWYSKRLANKVVGEDKCIPVFEICTDVELRNPYFTYQDMTYIAGQYVKELKVEHSFIWGAAGNDVYGQTEINRRIRRQEKMYKNACGILWMGEWLHDYMTSQYPALSSKMYYIGGGTNLDPSKINDSQKSGNKFLFVGRDYERKGGDLVLSAFNILREKYMPSAELHIAGPENMDFNDEYWTENYISILKDDYEEFYPFFRTWLKDKKGLQKQIICTLIENTDLRLKYDGMLLAREYGIKSAVPLIEKQVSIKKCPPSTENIGYGRSVGYMAEQVLKDLRHSIG